MEHKIRQQRWISYSIALLLAFTLSWGLTQPAQAAEEATQIGVNLSQGDPITGLTVTFRVQSNGGTEPITGSIIVQGSWGESCTKTLTAADNLPVPIGHMAGSTCQMSPPLGIYTITVTYGGNAFYAPSSRQNIEIISKYFADLVITAHTPNPSSIDQAVLVQYSVTAVRSLPFSPTGTVFVTDGVNSCISTPATGQCSLILETSGTRTLSASYSGDATFRGDSASVSHTVIGYATTTTITADSPDPSTQGQTVSVSYSVVANDPSKGTPSGNVTVSDGVASCTGTVAAGSCSLTLNTAGARTLTATYAGNSKFAGSISAGEPHTVNAPDTTPPVITASGTKADGSPYTPGTWTNQNVLVRFTCSDTGSGIATCPGDQLLSLDGTFTAEGTATDNAGNSATVSFGPIQIDKTAPTISAAATAAPNGNGWYNSNVTIHFTCADNLAGVTSCPADEILSSEGSAVSSTAQTISDIAGNSSAASNVVTVPIDKTAPVVTVTGVSAGGSYPLGSVPTAGCSTTDALSSVATQATLSITGGGGPLGADGTGNFEATCSGAMDNAGNSRTVAVGYTVTPPPDTTAPVITAQVNGTLGNNGWYVSDVTVSWTVVDAESAISSQIGCETQHVTSDTTGVTFTCSATSTGGTASQSVTIQRDATAPTISAATTAPNANGWYNNDVAVHFTCADALSGVTNCPADQVLSSEGAAVASTAQTVTDQAGNSSAASNVVTVKIDKTAPVVTITGVSNGATYTLGSVPAAGCSTSDALSGVATQATLSVTGGGGPLGADDTGSFTATCSGATDNAGNSGSASATYGVTYNWSGFFQPVDNLPVVNTVNAGSGIPVKFSLGGDYGLNILAAGYPKVQTVACGSGSGGSSNPIEETVTAGSSSLQYDPTTQTYIYVWKTDKAWAGACRQLIVRLIDGTDHIALFQFNGKVRSANGGESTPDEGEQTIETVNDALPRAFLPLVNR